MEAFFLRQMVRAPIPIVCNLLNIRIMGIKELVYTLSDGLPTNHKGIAFYVFAKNKLDEYVSALLSVDKNEFEAMLGIANELCGKQTQCRFVNLIKVINQECLMILQLAYKGDAYNATSHLLGLMTKRKYTKSYLSDRYLNYLRFISDIGCVYYRCLVVENNEIPQNCNHLPYSLRHFAGSSRFNQTGFPCLYIASSLNVAEKESNCKNEQNVYVGEFKAKRKLFYLNFCVPSKEEIEEMTEYEVFAFLVTYPLLLLCLVTTDDKRVKFHEEYLFPQLFFHLLYTTKCDDVIYWGGIRYTSTLDKTGFNIVVPASYKQQEPPTDNTISDFIEERFEQTRLYKK
jgi:hypothetical protein